MDFASKVKKMVADAPSAASGTNVNFGPLTVTPLVVRFHGKEKPEKFTLEEFADEQGVEVDDVELGQNETFFLKFSIDLSDINEALNFPYEREIAVQENSANGKVKTDWAEIVLPSLEATFGKDWYNKLLSNGKKVPPTYYVAAEAVDSLKFVKEGGKVYSVPKFVAQFGTDRDACIEARDARYPRRGDGESEETTADEEEEGFTEEALAGAKSLLKANKGDRAKTIAQMNKTHPFGDYDSKELLEAAVPSK